MIRFLGNCDHGKPWGECCEINRLVDRHRAEIERLRTIIKDAHEEMISERGEYHIKSGLG